MSINKLYNKEVSKDRKASFMHNIWRHIGATTTHLVIIVSGKSNMHQKGWGEMIT